MAKRLGVGTWSGDFLALLNSESKTLNIQQYDLCQAEWKAAHERKTLKSYVLAIVVFCAGLWAVWESAPFMAVLLIALAANFNRQSSHHVLFAELLESQRLLAMLVNSQTQEIAALRINAAQTNGPVSRSLDA